jgi:hypothetical protein
MEKIDLLQFKKLLAEIENTEVLIRIRLAGERWMEFSKVIIVSENACILEEENKPRRPVLNLRAVVEFAIDRPHLDYLVNTPYEVLRG